MNLDLDLKNILCTIDINNKPNLFLHVCCCPCSSHILLKLIKHFHIHIIFYNPNIDTKEEFDKRLGELKRFIDIIKDENIIECDIPIIYDDYIHREFLDFVEGYEHEAEGGRRCEKCFQLRLSKSCDIAYEYIQKNSIEGANYFCTSLSTSPHKNAMLIYDIGQRVVEKKGIIYLPSDFKKSNGYLDSIRLCEKYSIYRQNYCGCEFSKGA